MRQIVNTDNRPKWEGKDHPNISKITATYFLNHWLQNRFRNKNMLISNNRYIKHRGGFVLIIFKKLECSLTSAW